MKKQTEAKILVIDIGGTNIKVLGPEPEETVKFPSGKLMTPRKMVKEIGVALGPRKYTCVSIGYPGPVVHGTPVAEPHNLAGGWVGFDFKSAFGHPVKIVNDAALQALGSYEGGRMLFSWSRYGTGFGADR